ncbi:MAG: SdiA-regulated domain-containing protein [Opitutaceae bacterium]|nr:SdiA-regulated domain-containing protein [Opitutaceae bacterium]
MKHTTLAVAALIGAATSFAGPTSIDLSQYQRVGRYNLPHPTTTTSPSEFNLLGEEASGVAYRPETDTLFIIGDGGRSVTEVTKTGALVSSMTMAPGGSPQGTYYYDPEGITYVGGNKFVFVEERYRTAHLFTYDPTKVLGADVFTQSMKLGTNAGNVGLEGLSYDPATNGFIFVKEKTPIGIFQTTIDFAAGTASNGSPSTTNSTDLFNPALLGMTDTADVFALSNITSLVGGLNYNDLLVLSQENGKVVQVDRNGVIKATLMIEADLGDTLAIADMQHEGLVMDSNGWLYIVNENAGGTSDQPQLWVYAPIPEPSTYAALAGVAALGLAAIRRRQAAA